MAHIFIYKTVNDDYDADVLSNGLPKAYNTNSTEPQPLEAIIYK